MKIVLNWFYIVFELVLQYIYYHRIQYIEFLIKFHLQASLKR
jgi:hypothetical protein